MKALGLLGLGRRAEARAALASALEADPDNVGAAVLRRSLAAARGPTPEAASAARGARQELPAEAPGSVCPVPRPAPASTRETVCILTPLGNRRPPGHVV